MVKYKKNPVFESLAINLRKELLNGLELGALLDYEEQLNELVHKKVQRNGFISSPVDIHAYRFLKNLNLLEKRFIKSNSKMNDRFPWVKAYTEFHESIRASSIEKLDKIYEQWKGNIPERIFSSDFESSQVILSDRKQEAVRGFQMYLNHDKLYHLHSLYKSIRESLKNEDELIFAPSRYLWKVARKGKGVEWLLNHAFATQPLETMSNLVRQIQNKKKDAGKRVTETALYIETEKKLKQKLVQESNGAGIFVDLTEVVRRVSKQYFPAMDGIPKVSWTGRFSVRKLAHYSEAKDEIAFSLIFDQPGIDSDLLDYLAYHELLHREIGTVRNNGRRYAHTPEFKKRERMFPGYDQLEKSIHLFSQKGLPF